MWLRGLVRLVGRTITGFGGRAVCSGLDAGEGQVCRAPADACCRCAIGTSCPVHPPNSPRAATFMVPRALKEFRPHVGSCEDALTGLVGHREGQLGVPILRLDLGRDRSGRPSFLQ